MNKIIAKIFFLEMIVSFFLAFVNLFLGDTTEALLWIIIGLLILILTGFYSKDEPKTKTHRGEGGGE